MGSEDAGQSGHSPGRAQLEATITACQDRGLNLHESSVAAEGVLSSTRRTCKMRPHSGGTPASLTSVKNEGTGSASGKVEGGRPAAPIASSDAAANDDL
jgi:hypothetical protein